MLNLRGSFGLNAPPHIFVYPPKFFEVSYDKCVASIFGDGNWRQAKAWNFSFPGGWVKRFWPKSATAISFGAMDGTSYGDLLYGHGWNIHTLLRKFYVESDSKRVRYSIIWNDHVEEKGAPQMKQTVLKPVSEQSVSCVAPGSW